MLVEAAAHHKLRETPRFSVEILRSLRAQTDALLRFLSFDSATEKDHNVTKAQKSKKSATGSLPSARTSHRTDKDSVHRAVGSGEKPDAGDRRKSRKRGGRSKQRSRLNTWRVAPLSTSGNRQPINCCTITRADGGNMGSLIAPGSLAGPRPKSSTTISADPAAGLCGQGSNGLLLRLVPAMLALFWRSKLRALPAMAAIGIRWSSSVD